VLSERFWLQVDKTDACWLWTGYVNDKGYGYFNRKGVHRLMMGDIPEGMEVDHLCNVRNCCNPEHLEIVTKSENESRKFDRKEFCNHGHRLTPDNIKHRKNGRCCRRCFNDRRNAWRSRRG
jgi:hypothetical protein